MRTAKASHSGCSTAKSHFQRIGRWLKSWASPWCDGTGLAHCKARKHLSFRPALEILESRIAPTTDAWIGGSGNWDVASNWSTGQLPTPSDDAILNTAAAATITIQSGDNISVHSLTTAGTDTLDITGGSLTVDAGSTLSGNLAFGGGSLIVAGGIFQVNGATSIQYTGQFQATLEATGAGSTLTLPNVSSFTVGTGSWDTAVAFKALAGGTVNLTGLSQLVTGPVGLESDGAGSVMNVSALTSFSGLVNGNSVSGGNIDSWLQVTNGGTLQDGVLKTLTHVDITSDGTGSWSSNQIISYKVGAFSLSGGSSLVLPNLVTVNDSSFLISGGASLSLPGVTSFTNAAQDQGGNGFTSMLEATGVGSTLTLANLNSLTVATNLYRAQVDFEALAGGAVNVPALAQIDTGPVGLESDGTGSVLDVSALASFTGLPNSNSIVWTNIDSWFRVTNGGALGDGVLGAMTHVDLTSDGTGSWSASQIGSYQLGTFSLTGGTLVLPTLSNINNSNFLVSGGASLSLPGVSSASYTISPGDVAFEALSYTLQASGAGSTLTLANLNSLTVSTSTEFARVDFKALAGGTVNLNALAQIDTGPVGLESDGVSLNGVGSVLNVPALSSVTALPNSTSLYTTNIDSWLQVSNGGSLNAGKLATLVDVDWTVSGPTENLTINNVTSFNGNLTVSGGASLSLPEITGLSNTTKDLGGNGFTHTLQATGIGSTLTLANLNSVTVGINAAQDGLVGPRLYLDALAGGTVNLNSLTQVDTGPFGLDSDGPGSVLNAPALKTITAQPNLNGLEVFIGVNDNIDSWIGVSNNGTLNAGSLTGLTNTDISVGPSENLTWNTLTSFNGGNITVSGGASLSLPGITSYTPSAENTLEATGYGSNLNLAHLTNVIVPPNNTAPTRLAADFKALAGGSVDISALASINTGEVGLVSDGQGSLLNASTLHSVTTQPNTDGYAILFGSSNVNSWIVVSNNGTLETASNLSLSNVNMTVSGYSSTFAWPVTNLDLTGSSITVNSGATLSLPNLASLTGNAGTLTSDGTSSMIQLPATTTYSNSNVNITVTNSGSLQLGSTLLTTPVTGNATIITIPQLPAGISLTLGASGTFSGGTTFNIAAGDVVALTGGGTFTGGATFNVASGGSIDLTGGQNPTFSGLLTGSGGGTVQLSTGTITPGTDGLTLDFPSTMFQWFGGSINGNVINQGTLNIANGGTTDGDFDNRGSLTVDTGCILVVTENFNESGNVSVDAGGTLTVEGNYTQTASGVLGVQITPTLNAVPVDLSPYTNADLQGYTNGFYYPSGGSSLTVGNVPFTLSQYNGGGTGIVQTAAASQTSPSSFDIPVNIGDPTTVYTLINSTFGQYSSLDGSVEFFASNGAEAQFNLSQGTNIRDHNDGGYNNVIGPGISSAFFGECQVRLDMQTFVLPSSFDNATLTDIRFNGYGNDSIGEPFLAAVSVVTTQTASTPSGGTSFGQVNVSGAANLAGAFDATPVNGFKPTSGPSFQVMTFGSAAGNFTSLSIPSPLAENLNPTNLTLAGPITITSPSTLPSGTAGQLYSSQQFSAAGGSGTYAFSSTSNLDGLSLTSYRNLYGAPNAAGSFPITITATDSNGLSGSVDFTLTVTPAAPTGLQAVAGNNQVSLNWTDLINPAGTVSYDIYRGTTGSGQETLYKTGLSGTSYVDSSVAIGDTFYYEITAVAGSGQSGDSNEASATLQALPPPITIGPATLPAGTVGGPSSQTVTASGGRGTFTFQITSGSLPPGLTLNPSSGVLSGMPYLPGTYSFTVKASDSYSDAGSQNYTVTVASPLGTSPNAIYVENLYGLLLNRPADSGGSYWVNQLDQGVSPSNLVIAIESSYEYLRNLVTGIYQHYLNRAPDAGGLSYWVGLLQSGWTAEQVVQGFIASPEFYRVQGGGTNAGFITVFYQDILGRQPDPAGYAYWLNGMNTGAVTSAGLAAGFLTSQEYRNDLVNSYYQQFLRRNADAGGLAYWTGEMAAGITDQQVLAAILGAPEPFADWS